MILPIPISVRTSSVQVRKPVESDYGGEYGEPETIENVRFEGVSAMVRDEYRLVDGAKGLLWVDATSKGAFAIPEGSLVSVDGGEWLTAASVAPFKGFGTRIHHWEIQLS